jgi:hypothetical protein
MLTTGRDYANSSRRGRVVGRGENCVSTGNNQIMYFETKKGKSVFCRLGIYFSALSANGHILLVTVRTRRTTMLQTLIDGNRECVPHGL